MRILLEVEEVILGSISSATTTSGKQVRETMSSFGEEEGGEGGEGLRVLNIPFINQLKDIESYVPALF